MKMINLKVLVGFIGTLIISNGVFIEAGLAIENQNQDEQEQLVDKIIAVVNDDIITLNQLEDQIGTVIKQMRQQRAAIPKPEELRKQMLDRMIQRRLQIQVAEGNHIKVDDETLNKTILQIASENKLSLSQFREILEREGFDYNTYRENIRDEILISRLQQRLIGSRVMVTDQEVDDLLKNQIVQGHADDEFHISHILVEVPEAASPEAIQKAKDEANGLLDQLKNGTEFSSVAITGSDGQQALNGGDLGWKKLGQLPTIFSDLIPTMKIDEISDLIRSPSGFHIIKLIDRKRQSRANIITQTKARHILIRTNQLTSNEDAENRLTQIKQRVLGGGDFVELAKSNSDDSASAVDGGDLGWVNPGDLDPSFEAVMDDLKDNEISEPFKTQFGWHIVQVLERKQFDNTDTLRISKAKQQIRERKIEEETQNWLRRIRDEAYVDIRI